MLKKQILNNINSQKITIVGLGYVGLPLAIEFGKKYQTLGIDINKARIEELKKGEDHTKECTKLEISSSKNLTFSNTVGQSDIYIITVPTPIDKYKKPDLGPLLSASKSVGKFLKKGNIVIYESTVYPGCTEEDCVPILEKTSGLKFNYDFFCGYSPERINPGDKLHTVTKIKKITSGSNAEVADFVDELYNSIIEAGTYKAQSIKVAEAAKVIENCQRDINIAFVNELALIFNKMEIDTLSVLEAAGTKWNFLPFRPGLVGGHCIGVDPYYLTYKAESLGYHSEVMLAGRHINDNMGKFVANQVIKLMTKAKLSVHNSKILVLGITFKENCPDIRNSRVIDIIDELKEFGCQIFVADTWADKTEVKKEYELDLVDNYILNDYDAVVLAVAHNHFIDNKGIENLQNYQGILYDVKSILNKELVTDRL